MEQNHNLTKQSGDELKIPIPPRLPSYLENLGVENPIVKKYLSELEKYENDFEKYIQSIPKKREREPLPELFPIDTDYFYEFFKQAFFKVNGKFFNESENDFEARKLARTFLAYFFRNKSFLKSPILNHKSEPSLNKGILMIGDFGIGKTSIVRTYHEIFKRANEDKFSFDKPKVFVKDKNGTFQILGRYENYFNFFTTIGVVNDYEAIKRNDKKSFEEYDHNKFRRIHNFGFNYYDDIMSERMSKNFGNVELFKEILEERYSNNSKTMLSLNYVGGSIENTLNAFAERYGERNYDRIFEKYNIIELKGKSLRK